MTGALVSSVEGEVLGESGVGEPPRAAALATFIARRAESLSLDGDLRGMGRLLATGHLEHVAISGDAGDALVLAPGSCFVFLTLQRAYPAASVATPAYQASYGDISSRYAPEYCHDVPKTGLFTPTSILRSRTSMS